MSAFGHSISSSLVGETGSERSKSSVSPWPLVFWAWLSSRFWIGLFAYLGHATHPFQEKIPGGWEGVSSWWLNVWTTYDSLYFLGIAAHGYTPQSSVFFPLYSLVLRPFGPSYNAMALSGVIVSNVCFLGALWLLYDLTRHDYNEEVARRVVWITAFFPTAAFSMAVYTESFYLVFALATFWFVRRHRWGGAAPFALLASLARNIGPIFTLALGVEWWMQRKRGQNPPLWGLLVALVPAFAFVGMQLYFRSIFGSGLSSVSNQALFGRALMFPLIPVWRDFFDFVSGKHTDLVTLLNWLATVGSFVLVWRWRREQPPADAILLCGVMLLQLTVAHLVPPYTNSSLRYAFLSWPFAQLVALQSAPLLQNRLRILTVVLMGLFLAAFHSFFFGQKVYLG